MSVSEWCMSSEGVVSTEVSPIACLEVEKDVGIPMNGVIDISKKEKTRWRSCIISCIVLLFGVVIVFVTLVLTGVVQSLVFSIVLKTTVFDKSKILVYKHNESFIPELSYGVNSVESVLVRHERYEDVIESDPYCVDTSSVEVFPGAILFADEGVLLGKPRSFPVSQSSIRVAMRMKGGREMSKRVSIDREKIEIVRKEMEVEWRMESEVLNEWKVRGMVVTDRVGVSSRFNSETEELYDHLPLRDGVSINDTSSQIVLELKQVWFSMDSSRPEDLIVDRWWSVNEMRKMMESTPLVYVSSEEFGRVIYVELHGEVSSDELMSGVKEVLSGMEWGDEFVFERDGIVEGVMRGVEGKRNEKGVLNSHESKHSGIMEKCKCSYWEKGENEVHSGEIGEVIKKTYERKEMFSSVPLTYSMRYLRDDMSVRIGNEVVEVRDVREEYKHSELMINHEGSFMVRFNVRWEVVSYGVSENSVGRKFVEEMFSEYVWSESGKVVETPFHRIVKIPVSSRNLIVLVEHWNGWIWVQDVFRSSAVVKNDMIVRVSGTISNPDVVFELNDLREGDWERG